MTAPAFPKRGHVALGSIAFAAILYRLLLRRPILNWGATHAEANARLPGDELLEEADGVATRAITIDAPASALVMEQKMLRGIKRRAERLAAEGP